MKQVMLDLKPSYRYILPENYISNGHDFVEIGGIKWATMNVGAKNVTDSGLYFAWGETKGYKPEEVGTDKDFEWQDYKFGYHNKLSKYSKKDKLTTLQFEDDPVTDNWGGSWRLPTKEEFVALGKATTSKWVKNYQGSGVNGLLVKDKSDSSKQLFFPAAGNGYRDHVYYVGLGGVYWSSSLCKSNPTLAWNLYFDDSDDVDWGDHCNRRSGLCARGVLGV